MTEDFNYENLLKNEKASQALKILTKKQLQFIRDRLETGGK